MAVIAIYFILKAFGLTSGGCDSRPDHRVPAGSGAGFYVMKGYMDTIPMSLDEAAYLDGCTTWQVFTKITIPYLPTDDRLSGDRGIPHPVARLRHGEGHRPHAGQLHRRVGTVADASEGIHQRLVRAFRGRAVCVSIPIAILFIVMQRFYQESMSGSVKG